MKSFLTIDRIKGKFAICELECVSVEQSRELEYWNRSTEMVDIPVIMLDNPCPGDVFVVEHEKETLYRIYGKNNQEKQKRMEALKGIMG